jgi:hypothetical protein
MFMIYNSQFFLPAAMEKFNLNNFIELNFNWFPYQGICFLYQSGQIIVDT